ncbi:hypothetical protein TSUD_344560 [Trifolium subterraneum]|nr:hypothetical protein TSUD_344560 [Trifolium subterraneum]
MGDSKRIAIIGVSTFLLVAMVVAVTVSIGNTKNEAVENSKDSHVSSSMKAVKTLCAPTEYKKECEESLTENARNITDPRELIKIAFNITITKIGEGLEKTQLLHEVENDPRTKGALDTCKELMHLSTEEFKRSLDRFGNFDLNSLDRVLTSLKVWLSGAITYQETCLDAFENTTTDAGHKMQEILKTAMHMSSNGLSIINELSKTFADMKPKGRRLLEENYGEMDVFGNGDFELPEWVEDPVQGDFFVAIGLIIQGGSIVSDPKYYPVRFDNKAYLARPWKNFSRTIFMDTYIGDLITPDGYMPWQTLEGISGTDTCFYAEFNNRGPGSDISKRVKWPGIKTITSQGAAGFLPTAFFHGDDWIRVTRVPYYPGGAGASHKTPTH